MYGNYPVNNFNNQMYMQDLQNMRDRIDKQMMQMQQPIQQQQTPAINQTFQITPNNSNASDLEGKVAKDFEEVKNTLVMRTAVFLNSDYTTAWIKDVSGNIRTFELNEVIELDEKDKQILALQKQIEEMKGMMTNAKYDNADVDESTSESKSTNVSTNKSTKK